MEKILNPSAPYRQSLDAPVLIQTGGYPGFDDHSNLLFGKNHGSSFMIDDL